MMTGKTAEVDSRKVAKDGDEVDSRRLAMAKDGDRETTGDEDKWERQLRPQITSHNRDVSGVNTQCSHAMRSQNFRGRFTSHGYGDCSYMRRRSLK